MNFSHFAPSFNAPGLLCIISMFKQCSLILNISSDGMVLFLFNPNLFGWEFWDVSWATGDARCLWTKWWTWWRRRWRRWRPLRRRSAKGWSVWKILKTGSKTFPETRRPYSTKCSGWKRRIGRLQDLVLPTWHKQQQLQPQQQLQLQPHQKATILAATDLKQHQILNDNETLNFSIQF